MRSEGISKPLIQVFIAEIIQFGYFGTAEFRNERLIFVELIFDVIKV